MSGKRYFTEEQAKKTGDELGIKWDKFDIEQFRQGMDVELEHGLRDPKTNVTNNDSVITGKIALAHLNEFPDYYTRLEKLEEEAEKFWEGKKAKKGFFSGMFEKLDKKMEEKAKTQPCCKPSDKGGSSCCS